MSNSLAVKSSVSYRDIKAEASYKVVVVSTSWVDIHVVAEATFPDRLVVDVVTPSDVLTWASTKRFADETLVSDVSTWSAGKGLSDSIDADDEITFDSSKIIDTDSVEALEEISLEADKAIQNYVTPYDTLSFEPNIALLNNQVFMTDTTAIQFEKVLDDSVTMFDHLDATRQYDREFTDESTVTDEIAFGAGVVKTDAVSPSDDLSTEATKGLSDSVTPIESLANSPSKGGLADSAAPTDQLDFVVQFSRAFTDSFNQSDDLFVDVTKSLSDSASVSDLLEVFRQINTAFTDSVTTSEVIAWSVNQSVSDSVSATDSVDFTLIEARLLNDTPVNTYTLN